MGRLEQQKRQAILEANKRLLKEQSDTDNNKMVGCLLIMTPTINSCISTDDTTNMTDEIKDFIKGRMCENNTCPSCNDNTYYSINGSKCTDNLDTCLKCKSASNINWMNKSSQERVKNTSSDIPINYTYDGSNILKDCKDTSNFCKKQQSDCFTLLKKKSKSKSKKCIKY